MIELKTLKDLTYGQNHIPNSHANPKELRQELGIKWIKAFEKGERHTDFAADGRNGQENIIEWIKHIFNISDEDLKSEIDELVEGIRKTGVDVYVPKDKKEALDIFDALTKNKGRIK